MRGHDTTLLKHLDHAVGDGVGETIRRVELRHIRSAV
jgi:hypothetical protein